MIFENAYGEWLRKLINENLRKIKPNTVVKIYHEFSYKPLYKNSEEIALIINGGNATRSSVKGLDQNVMPLLISVICRSDNKNAVRNALDYVQENYNAVPMILTYEDNVMGQECSVKCKSIFNTPICIDERDHPTKTETIKITVLQVTVSVVYGKNAYIHPISFQLEVNGVNYPIENIATYDMASSPAYDEFISQGECFLSRFELSQCAAFAFTLYRLNYIKGSGGLQEILDNEILCADGGLRNSTLKLLAYPDTSNTSYRIEVPITKYSLAEGYANNASAYQLTLAR